MARTRSTPLAKGKAKLYRPPTRASPRLAALRSQGTVQPQPEAPVTPTVSIPKPSLPPKKRPIPREVREGTSKAATTHIRRHSQRLAALSRVSRQAPKDQELEIFHPHGTSMGIWTTGRKRSQQEAPKLVAMDPHQRRTRCIAAPHLHRGPCNFQVWGEHSAQTAWKQKGQLFQPSS
ncbi:hypothetical protein PIB30_086624 [Stylosanthes scabra]|uniref:Uncharacterized protein n=1 Tax=Stylosanthes scabra TaxID=79078 RepID=A0ABU6WRI4_9FABA|nr:hypothetical protein [Stylosanthes scabra]